MTQTAVPGDDFRARILADPDVILSDHAVMKALIAARDAALGDNVVDLRGIAMERLEARLGRLESTHRSVIAAAYENLAGTNMIHRAVLRLLEPADFAGFLRTLSGDVAEILQVESVKLVLETHQTRTDPALARLAEVVVTAEPGFIAGYLSTAPVAGHGGARAGTYTTGQARRQSDRPATEHPVSPAESLAPENCDNLSPEGSADLAGASPADGEAGVEATPQVSLPGPLPDTQAVSHSGAPSGPASSRASAPVEVSSRPARRITLRILGPGEGQIHGARASLVRSEACLRLDLGTGRLPGMLVLGAADAQQFRPTHGTDLLAFLTDVFERLMRRWLG